MTSKVQVVDGLSLVRGIPLADEQGVGALTLGGYVREIKERYGPRQAAVFRIGDTVESWTYDELYERSVEVAQALIASGVGKGARVGIVATNRLEFLSCVFGTGLAGGVASPISTFNTATELETVLKMAAPTVILLERGVLKKDFAVMLAEIEPAVATAKPGEIISLKFPFLRHVATINSEETVGAVEGWSAWRARGAAIPRALVDATAASVAPSDPGVLLFSSGSTGKSKGILSANRGVCLQMWRWAQWYNTDPAHPPRTWSANGFFWSGNFASAMGATLSAGGTLVLQRWFDAKEALWLMEKERATMPIAWPHQWAQLTAEPSFATTDLSSLIYVDALTPLAQHPTVTSAWREPAQAYGNTETFTLISVFGSGTPPEVSLKSHGEPTAGASIKIVDPLTGHIVPVGERGEIAVKGPTVMMGYVGIPVDESMDDEGFLRTNDGGYVDAEGRLFWEGRLNDIIKTGGANVSPLEIDEVIRGCSGVKVSQTVGVPDELLGELVVTCIVPHEGAALTEEAIRAFAKEKLASYKLPRRVLFFNEGDVALTGTAKIKTADLRKLATERLEAETA
ncbi:acyl--CoA ligase [Sphingobium sufflavum]|uniref:class I adenylate-forming enzyme family protein n=1 Tax=Sphingobium sufflavum TaxID=1129547 RepID=UPI001F31EA3E|nr:class I adenylate-forming enzyme family protein [Sphingobium sufflavum]MCE7796905.1 acyl--CoA ligase [Sphingobium sufflavum]